MIDTLKPKPNLEIVRTGSKPFPLFPQEKTHKRLASDGKTHIYDRHISLDTDDLLPPLPIRLYTGATHMSALHAMSPYTNEGYPKDPADQEKDIDYAAAPLCLDASTHVSVLRNMKLTQQTKSLPDPLLPEVQEIFSHLRFHVTLPTKGTFVSRPDETAFTLGELSFRLFTPQDSPTEKARFLMLPSDDKIIQSIKGQFLDFFPNNFLS